MPADKPLHRCRVLTSPNPGIHATRIESGRHYPRHWHATYGLGVMDDGAHRSSSDGRSFDAFRGDILCTNPGEVHDGRPLAGPVRHWRTAYIEPGVLAQWQAETGACGELRFANATFSDPQVRAAVEGFLDAMEAWTEGRAGTLAFEESFATAIGLMVGRHAGRALRPDPAIELDAVLQRLGDDLALTPSLEELARLAGIGRFQLLRRFRRVFGTTPHGWLMQHRAERARVLIRRGTPLVQAAAQCGFADQSHMTRVFVQRFGFTPGAWKKAQ